MSFNRSDLQKTTKLAEQAINEDPTYLEHAIKTHLKMIYDLEHELADLDDNENLFLAYNNLAILVTNYLEQNANFNLNLFTKCITAFQNCFNHQDPSFVKYRNEIHKKLTDCSETLNASVEEIERLGNQQINISDFKQAIHTLQTVIANQPNLATDQRKRKETELNNGLTERQAVKKAKRISLYKESNQPLMFLANLAIETDKETKLVNELQNCVSTPSTEKNDAPSAANSTFTLFPVADQPMQPSYFGFVPPNFAEWYEQLKTRQPTGFMNNVKPYVPEPNEMLFNMFKKEYRQHYGRDSDEVFQPQKRNQPKP